MKLLHPASQTSQHPAQAGSGLGTSPRLAPSCHLLQLNMANQICARLKTSQDHMAASTKSNMTHG